MIQTSASAPSPSTAGHADHGLHAGHPSLLPHWLIHLGGLGLFAVAALDASPIPLPVPGSADLLLLLLVSHRGNPFVLAAAAIAGSVLGGYTTWSAGLRGGEALLRRSVPKRFLQSLEHWVTNHSFLAVLLPPLLPPPIPLTPFLLAAGALHISRRRFLVALTTARTLRYGLVAWAAAVYGRLVVRWWTQRLAGWSSVILWTFVALLVGGIVFGLWQYRRQKRAQAKEQAFA